MPTKNVNLTEHFSAFVDRLVDSGKYESASEVMRTALRLLEQRTEEEARKLKLLRKLAKEGLDSLDRGEGIKFNSADELGQYFDALGEKVARRIKEDSAG